MPGTSDNESRPPADGASRYLRDDDVHGHCSCGARLLKMPWGQPALCAACGREQAGCTCPDATCESCGLPPTTAG